MSIGELTRVFGDINPYWTPQRDYILLNVAWAGHDSVSGPLVSMPMTQALPTFFHDYGYVVARGLFYAGEVALIREHFMPLFAAGTYPGGTIASAYFMNAADQLQKYPRLISLRGIVYRWGHLRARRTKSERNWK